MTTPESTTAVAAVKAPKIILMKTKGFDGLDEASLSRKNAVFAKFVEDGKAVWSLADYLGFTGAGKGSAKQADVVRQLSEHPDSEACKRTLELIPQIALRFENGPVTVESVPLRAYFSPYLKSKSTPDAVDSSTVTVDSFEGLDQIGQGM